MPSRERTIEQSLVPPSDYHIYSRLFTCATGTVQELRAAWKRPKRHNRRIERAALWHVLDLSTSCAEVLGDSRAWSLLCELEPKANASERYEVQAAIHTVQRNLPFTPEERNALSHKRLPIQTMEDAFFETERIANSEPALVEQWHRWVWEDEHHVPRTSLEALGASAILAEGCFRLNQSLPKVLGWETTSE